MERATRNAGVHSCDFNSSGLLPGVAFADVVMVELRDIHAALQTEQIHTFRPFSRWRLEYRLGISEPKSSC
ncbi:MAG: hypothetical protein ACLQDV_25115 [Candidatus Binataceae bacterium]